MSIDKRITRLEKSFLSNVHFLSKVPGTILQRTLMSTDLAFKNKIKITKKAQRQGCILVWSLAIGPLSEPKHFIYDTTIEGVLKKAEEVYEALEY